MSSKGFHAHIQEAIITNKRRKLLYARRSAGKTKVLSNVLITSEILAKSIAKYYDKKAKPFNKQGIMIVKNDFVPIDIPTFDTDVKRQSAWSNEMGLCIKSLISEFLQTTPKGYRCKADLNAILDKGRVLYRKIEQLEEKYDLHCPMCKHMLESICFISKNGIEYAKQSQDSTLKLSGSLLNWHKIVLKNSPRMDKWANKFHQQNIGILINDMPLINIF